MFSTLLGSLPPEPVPAAPDADDQDRQRDDTAVLAATGLELVTDGGEPAAPGEDPRPVVARWQAAAEAVATPVKAVLLGPWSAALREGGSPDELADRLRPTILALAEVGCPFVEIAEPDALAIATDPAVAVSFGSAQRRLVDGTEGIHCSLALTGGNHDGVPPATLFDAGYASYAFDLIAGPDDWRLIAQAPGDRGIVCGALGLADGADETREILVWAAHYAASTNGRGLVRVGLANAPASGSAVAAAGASGVPPARAEVLRKLAIVAEASRIAAVESAEEMAGLLDRRALDPRTVRTGRLGPARFDPTARRRR